MAEQFLLHAAATLLHRLQPEPDHMEGIEDGGGVLELVADSVGVATRRIQRGGANLAGEGVPAGTQPVGIDLPGPARHQVQQPRLRLAVAPGQVHNAGLLPRPLAGSRLMVPDVLIDPDSIDSDESVGIVGQLLQQRLDCLPDGVPVHAEPAGDRGDRGVVSLDAAERPPGCSHRELGPRRRQPVIFAKPADWADQLEAPEAALSPQQLDRRPERRDVVQPP
jgi:hypothetical protein